MLTTYKIQYSFSSTSVIDGHHHLFDPAGHVHLFLVFQGLENHLFLVLRHLLVIFFMYFKTWKIIFFLYFNTSRSSFSEMSGTISKLQCKSSTIRKKYFFLVLFVVITISGEYYSLFPRIPSSL